MSHRKLIILGSLVTTLVVAIVFSIVTLVGSSPVQAKPVDAPGNVRYVTVVGNGSATGTPDTATVQIGVETDAPTAQEALANNNIHTTEVISRLVDLDVAEKDIKTSNFSIYTRYDDKGREITGYQVNNTVSVLIRDLETAGELLDQVVLVGANSIYGISFSVEDPSELIKDARDNAMDDALAKAKQLAKKGGASVGDVLVITENIGSQPKIMMGRDFAEADIALAPSVPIQAGEQDFSVQVQVTYELQ